MEANVAEGESLDSGGGTAGDDEPPKKKRRLKTLALTADGKWVEEEVELEEEEEEVAEWLEGGSKAEEGAIVLWKDGSLDAHAKGNVAIDDPFGQICEIAEHEAVWRPPPEVKLEEDGSESEAEELVPWAWKRKKEELEKENESQGLAIELFQVAGKALPDEYIDVWGLLGAHFANVDAGTAADTDMRTSPAATCLALPCWPNYEIACPEEQVAMQVLARHAVRLGTSGPSLERAVLAARRKVRNAHASCWRFLTDLNGMEAYLEVKRRFERVFAEHGRRFEHVEEKGRSEHVFADKTQNFLLTRRGDEEVRRLLPARPGGVPMRPPSKPVAFEACAAPVATGTVELPIPEIRFAHDCQREHFGHIVAGDSEGYYKCHGSFLQLAVELLAGRTRIEAVPTFSVCFHNGHWHCYNGNRRLAAFRLAHRFAPDRFARVMVKAVPVDDAFLKGTNGVQPKLTTCRNGTECNGTWLVVRETGEAVGLELPGLDEYGADLLSLLPRAGRPGPTPRGSVALGAKTNGRTDAGLPDATARAAVAGSPVATARAAAGA
mmetsp:Transcript_14337/g.39579  ORF Transcript_14337/g.39579 Transcript_14337/m.39579 type:complete len:550 (-) Transcript_14337:170-1819(-)